MEEPEVICERRGAAGIVVLNRPRSLNALTLGMVRAIAAALDEWEADPAVTRVVLTAAGDKAFCAGGDIRLLYEQGLQGDHAAQLQFWREEYTLNRRLRRYRKPTVALVDGIVMGGGVGVSVHAAHRVAGDRFLFAMPEVGIGFFPDVGATYVLPRLAGKLGTYLALTGARIGPGDAVACGIATAYVPSDRLPTLAAALCDTEVAEAIASCAAPPPPAALAGCREAIDRCFAAPTLPGVLARLEEAQAAAFAPAALAAIRAHAPLSLAIALRQMQIGAGLDLETAMRIEFRIVSRICRGHDFYEGVRAGILEREHRPAWDPATLDAVAADLVDQHFAPLERGELALPDRFALTGAAA